MLIVVSPSLERLLIEMAVGDDVYPVLRNSMQNAARRICLSARLYDSRSRRRSACGHVGICSICGVPVRRPRTRGAAAFSANSGAGRGDCRVSESRRRVGVGQPRIHTTAGENAPVVPSSDRLASSAVVSGACVDRAAGAADRRQGSRPGRWVLERRIRQAERQRSRDPRGGLARAEYAARGLLRSGQQLEPRAEWASPTRRWLTWRSRCESGSHVAGQRADRDARNPGEDGGDGAWAAGPDIWGIPPGNRRLCGELSRRLHS